MTGRGAAREAFQEGLGQSGSEEEQVKEERTDAQAAASQKELQEPEGMTQPCPKHTNFFMVLHLGELRQDKQLINDINPRAMASGTKTCSNLLII
jgi:hypothetical protein